VTNLLRASSRSLAAPTSERYDDWHAFGGNQYWNNVLSSWDPKHEGIGSDFANLVGRAYKGNAVVYACEMTRMALVSEARPQWRRIRNGRRGDLFGTQDLSVLERPWPGGTFRQLASRMVLNADMAGTAFVARRRERPDRLMMMRPDWVVMVLGSDDEPDGGQFAMDADLLGVMYYPGGQGSGRNPIPLLSDEVAVWAPSPDPAAAYRGVSWLSAVGREIDADVAATTHKLAFFENGATPQVIVSFGPEVKREHFRDFVAKMNNEHAGVANAYKTLAIGGGATPHVVGKDLHQLDFKVTQGGGETRIAAASGVHPVVAALSEGMAGSSLNAGNFRAACRLVADRTLRPLWGGLFAALEQIVPPPSDADLWYAEKEISFLQEDRKDAAEIEFTKAQTIAQLVREGFEPQSVIQAVEAEDMNLLVHSGLLSVQLQPPGAQQKPTIDGSTTPAAITAGGTP
jgi:phage portal protein BeeE